MWLSSIGQVSFYLDAAAANPANHTSVAWVIENTQTQGEAMAVTRSAGTLATQFSGPVANNVNIGKTLEDLSIASIFTNNRSTDASRSWPEPIVGVRLISTSQYELWRSDASTDVNFRTEVVEWPTADPELTQNYYRLYVNSTTSIAVSNPWPETGSDLGENTEMTGADDPMGLGAVIRIRMTVAVSGASLPAGIESYRLEYAKRSTTCSALDDLDWSQVGEIGSSTAPWRGYDNDPIDGTALSGNPPTGGDLLISIADIAGTYEEENISATNPFNALPGDDVEFDWVVQHNGADDKSSYCFRMTFADGTPFQGGYNFYPVLRTVGFDPRIADWRWYDDETNATPASPLASENVAPADVADQNALKLRLVLREASGAGLTNTKFALQFSEYADFSQAVATGPSPLLQPVLVTQHGVTTMAPGSTTN